MVNSMTVKTDYGTYENCYLELNSYVCDGSLSIQILNDEDGAIAHITKCFLDESGAGENRAYIDTNNCPWLPDFIEKYQLGRFCGISILSGWYEYPLYDFNVEQVKEYCK